MKTDMKLIAAIVSLLIIATLSGCATAGQGTLPSGGVMTMSEIYTQQTGTTQQSTATISTLRNNTLPLIKTGSKTVITTAPNKANATPTPTPPISNAPSDREGNMPFKLMPNPEIPLHVYPHLVQNQGGAQPVPGYTSAFFMYRQNHFALPDEQY